MDTNNVTVAGGLTAAGYFLAKGLLFVAILVIGYFVANALGKLTDKILTRVGFDRAVERSGIRQALAQSGYHPSQILGRLAFYTAFLFVMQLAFGMFGPNPISDLLTRIIAFLPNIAVAIVITVIAASIAAAVKDIVSASLGGLSYGKFLANLSAVAIVTIGVFAALNQLDIAPAIVNGLFYAILAIVVGVSVVAIGGAGIVPLRARWESALSKVDQEMPRIRSEVSSVAPAPAPLPVNDDERRYLG